MPHTYIAYIDPGTGYTITTGIGVTIAFILSSFAVFILFFKKIFGFLKHNKRFTVILLIAIIIVFVIGIFMNMNKNNSDFKRRIIILGLDGLSPDIIERLIDKNRLPHFAQLKQNGYYRHLSTSTPSESPIAWSAFATGKNPGKHGLYDFIKRKPENYLLEIAQTDIENLKPKPVRHAKSFWHYTSLKKIPTVIIGCPVTLPPDKINGRMLSGMGVPDILGTQGTFGFYTSQPQEKNKDAAGNIFETPKEPIMRLYLLGPKKKLNNGMIRNITIPFVVILKENGVHIDIQNNHIELPEKKWSDWISVEFKLGLFKKIKGIFKFYLLEREPEIKLYISPVNFDPRSPAFPISYPKEYSKELTAAIGLYYTQGMPIDTGSINGNMLSEDGLLEVIHEVFREKKAMFDYEMTRLNEGILFCYFEESDVIQHLFWRYNDPQHPLYEKDAPGRNKDIIDNWYEKMDSLLGEVMSKMKSDDLLIVLSDHGFNTFRRTVHINSWLRQNGYLKLKDSSLRSGRELFHDVDWSQTKAYAFGFGGIYINQIGREPKGIVKPGEETENIKKEISQKIKQWQDTKYNSSIVNTVYMKEDIFWGSYTKDAPDLYVGFSIGYRASWQTAIGGCPEALIEDNLKKWSGDHLFDPKLVPGVLFTNFKINKENPSIYDLTPTILKISGYSHEELKELDLDGEPLTAQ